MAGPSHDEAPGRHTAGPALLALVTIKRDKTDRNPEGRIQPVFSFEGLYARAGLKSLAQSRQNENFTIFSVECFCPVQLGP